MINISIVIPCRNEEAYITDCVESILSSNIDKRSTEVIFVDGNSSDRTVEMILAYQKEYPFITVISNSKRYTPIGMNLGISLSKGAYIFVLSSHAKYEKTYFSELRRYAEELQADCVGAVLITEVKNKNLKSNAIKEVLSHKFGVGNASFRTGTDHITEVDTVAFGCYKKETFDTYGLFDERLLRNQDIELNKRIVNNGGKIYLVPDVTCTYYSRENFKDLAKNSYANGYWNILTAYYTKQVSSLSLRHFIPLLLVLSLILPALFSPFLPYLVWLAYILLGSYLVLVIIISFRIKNSSNSIWFLIPSFLVLHLSYGWGSLMGTFSVISKYIKGDT